MPFVSVVLPVLNEERYLAATLECLLRSDYPRDRIEVIVVDNGSTDGSFKIAQQLADRAVTLTDVNVGAVRNFGVEISQGEILVFLDSDCLVKEDWISKGVQKLTAGSAQVFGGNLYLREKPAWIEKYWLLDNQGRRVAQRDLLGSCIFIDKATFIAAGGFDTTVTSGEDTAITAALKALGCEIVIDPELGVVHLGNPQTVGDFVRRQAWHAENYARDLRALSRDKVFLLVVAYLAGILLLAAYFSGLPLPAWAAWLPLLVPPAVLSLKRMYRAGYWPRSPLALLSIYAIDHLYLMGRLAGFLRGLIRAPAPRRAADQ